MTGKQCEVKQRSQLLIGGLAMGLEPTLRGLTRNLVSPKEVLQEI